MNPVIDIFFILITCLLDIVCILWGEIVGVQGLKEICNQITFVFIVKSRYFEG